MASTFSPNGPFSSNWNIRPLKNFSFVKHTNLSILKKWYPQISSLKSLPNGKIPTWLPSAVLGYDPQACWRLPVFRLGNSLLDTWNNLWGKIQKHRKGIAKAFQPHSLSVMSPSLISRFEFHWLRVSQRITNNSIIIIHIIAQKAQLQCSQGTERE